jgi:hypothetical protein
VNRLSRSSSDAALIRTKQDDFTDYQLHVEFATPSEVKGNSQGRGNSGVFLNGVFEIQVLDSFENITYPDGQASAIGGSSHGNGRPRGGSHEPSRQRPAESAQQELKAASFAGLRKPCRDWRLSCRRRPRRAHTHPAAP